MGPISSRTERLLEWLRGASTGALLHFYVQTTPAPASRPMINRRGGVYYSKGYEAFLADLKREFAVLRSGASEGPLLALAEVIVQRPKTGKLPEPRGDIDNYLKGPLDAATQSALWGDDGQIVAGACMKRYAEPGELPGANLWIGTEAS